jgi:hypothetical protein
MDSNLQKFYDVMIQRKRGEALIKSLIDYDQYELRKAIYTPSEPFEMRVDEGRKLYDIVGFQDTSNFAISERLYNIFHEHQITGWKGYEIKIEGITEKYYGFQVVGKCGKLVRPVEAGFYTGYKFDYKSWDNSDFFSPCDTALLFSVEKVHDLMMKNKITNIMLTDLAEVRAYSTGTS